MATSPHGAASLSTAAAGRLLGLMMSLFFAFGFCTVLVDTLIPKLRSMFALSYAEVMLTQFCFFGAYFLISAPAGALIRRIGHLRGIALGLTVMAAGALLFTPAALLGRYPGFLVALFVLASGVTTVQVAANPLTAMLGPPDHASSRLTLAQAFNSLATMLGPLFGSLVILRHMVKMPDAATLTPAALAGLRKAAARGLELPFAAIAACLLILAAVCWAARRQMPVERLGSSGGIGRVLADRRLRLGAAAIFTYVGAEVAIGSSIINDLMRPEILGVAAPVAGSLVSIYWGLAMVGRFAGSAVLRRVPAGLALAVCACGAGSLALLSAVSAGLLAAASLLAIGLFNAIMFPTIFTLGIEMLPDDTAEASGVLCLAIVGGAVVPLLTGLAADRFGLGHALMVPALCYVWIAIFGIGAWRHGASTLTVSPQRA